MVEKVGLHFHLPCTRVLALQAILLARKTSQFELPAPYYRGGMLRHVVEMLS